MDQTEIRVRMNGGYLVAGRNPDQNYDGIYIVFESDDGAIIDVVVAECKSEFEKKKIDVYTYEDVFNEDYTRKCTLNVEDIYDALNR